MSFSLPPTVNSNGKRRGGRGTPGSCTNNSSRQRHNENHEPTPPTAAKTQDQQQQQHSVGHVPVEFETSVRIRPLSKKERDDYIVLEVVPPESSSILSPADAEKAAANATASSSSTPLLQSTSVALHPIPRPDLTPSSALILQTLSPETIQTCHDVEFRFDHVFDGVNASQDAHVYPTLGRPMAHAVMEPLMNMYMVQQDAAVAAIRKATHLVIAMGGQGSGKTYTCFGGGGCANGGPQISKRKTIMDGLVPRMIDSLFGQFLRISSQQKMHHQHPQRKSSFAVNLSMLQVNQSKNPKPCSRSNHDGSSSGNNDGCKVHDLFQPVVSKAIPSALLSPKVQSLVATFERSRSGGTNGTPNSFNNNKKTLTRSPGSSRHLDALVRVHQDPITHEFHVMNGHVRTCKSAERARDSLQEALQNSRKRSNQKRHQSHVLIQIQPVLLDSKTGHVLCEGGTIVVLDMAGHDDNVGGSSSSSGKTRLRSAGSSKRNKDSLPNRNDAHTAVLHCLRSIQFNEQLRRSCSHRGGGPSPEFSQSMSDLSCPSSSLLFSNQRAASFKQVPYRQHVLTMLLQPCFSPCKTDQTHVSILLTASPGHRDYREKKAILTEIESFWTRKAPPAKQVMTGCDSSNLPTTTSMPCQQPVAKLPFKPSAARNKNPRMQRDNYHPHSASDADDEFESAESKSSSTTSASERPPKNELFKKSRAAQHQTLDSLPVKLPYSARKKHQSRPLYPSSDADDEFESSVATELQCSATSSSSSTQQPPPHHDIFKTNMYQHSAPGVDNTHSMAYSNSSIEDDYYTLPPPIAPPANMTTLFTRSNSQPPPQRVMSPGASAPPEEHVVKQPLVLPAKPRPVVSSGSSRGGGIHVPFLSDFPGVSLPFGRTFDKGTSIAVSVSSGAASDIHPTGSHLQQQETVTASLSTTDSLAYLHSNSSKSLHEATNGHKTTDNMDSVSSSSGILADENGSSSTLNNTKFSAMKNINKLVHASKKKCERVFEKMSTELNSINISTKDNSNNNENDTMVLKDRIQELEVQNANLLRDNERLRHENEQLRARSTSSLQHSPENPWLFEQNKRTEILLQHSPSLEKQQCSDSFGQESTSWPLDPRLPGENNRLTESSPGKPGHGPSYNNNNCVAHLTPEKHMSSPESQASFKENAASSTHNPHQYSPKNQPLDGPLALMPGQPLAGSNDQYPLKQSDRLHFVSDRKPVCKSDQNESSSFLRSRSLAYPSDDENVSPAPFTTCSRGGAGAIVVPTPGDFLTEDKLKHQHRSAPTSPAGSFRGRRDDERDSRRGPGEAASDTSNFSSNYKSALYRWKA